MAADPVYASAGQHTTADAKTNPKDGAEMILIPAGEFLMGDGDQSGNPRPTVHMSSYYIYKNLVTVGMYERFCKETTHQMPPSPDFNENWAMKDHPIVRVSWNDAMAYCRWAGVTLPTEAQWEKAARGTDGRMFPWGNAFDGSKMWCSSAKFGEGSGTARVGRFPSGASPFGVLDMLGNVWQWCRDCYDDDFPQHHLARQEDSVNDTAGDVGNRDGRVLRGGSWYSYVALLFRAANGLRIRSSPTARNFNYGFRGVSPSP